jgi:hypothetical protein
MNQGNRKGRKKYFRKLHRTLCEITRITKAYYYDTRHMESSEQRMREDTNTRRTTRGNQTN